MENQQNLLESKFLALQAMYEETKTSQEACIQEAPPPIVISEKGSESMPNGTYAKGKSRMPNGTNTPKLV